MPELPEVETTKRGIEPHLLKNKLINCKVNNGSFRIPFEKKSFSRVSGFTINEIKRIAKYISIVFSDKSQLIIHLGMTGTLRVTGKPPNLKHDHIIFEINNGNHLIFNDPRRFGLVKILDSDEKFHLLDNNGPDPFDKQVDSQFLYQKITNRKSTIKSMLLNNKIISGIGNIYASEILFSSKISPTTNCNELTKEDCKKIIISAKNVLNHAIKFGGTTLSDYFNADAKPGYFKNELNVYERAGESCKKCSTKIVQIVQNNRSTYLCPKCQKT